MTFNNNFFNRFNGTTSYIEIPHNDAQLGANLGSGFTISAWIRVFGIGGSNAGRIIDKSTGGSGQDGFELNIFGSGGGWKPAIKINNGTACTATTAYYYGTWMHILTTITSAQIATNYVNGIIASAPTDLVQAINTITTTNAPRIGNRSTATDITFDGDIHDVKMWNKVLTASEITDDYAGNTPAFANLIHWFKLGGDYTDRGSVGVAATNGGSAAMHTGGGEWIQYRTYHPPIIT